MQHWEIVNNGQVAVDNDAEELWENAVSYFKWCDDNPVTYKLAPRTGKEAGKQFTVEATRPYTIKGLCLHCGIIEEYLMDCLNTKDKTSLYYIIVNKIKYVIHTQNLEGAMVGIFNPIFTAKVLNMEKEEAPSSNVMVEIVTGLPQLAKSENEVLKKLDLERGEEGKVDL